MCLLSFSPLPGYNFIPTHTENSTMRRHTANKRRSSRAFNNRARKTAKMNKFLSRRGGIRL